MGNELDEVQYLIYTLGGLLVISLLAWAMHAWWARRRPEDGGGAAGYLIKMVEGYELTPSHGSRQVRARNQPGSERWRCVLSDDTEAIRGLLEAPAVAMDRWRLSTGSHVITLADAQAAILVVAMCSKARDVRRAQRLLSAGQVEAERNRAAKASVGAGTYVSRGAHRAHLNDAGVAFARVLVGAGGAALGDAAGYLGITSQPGADWMPGNEFAARGGVLHDD